ncbi:ATP-binding cassette domain-containing protein [Sneathiella marina]|uniref:ATP-binding cassette domain-containing protein n=1 Tax=Sneathiella marina TaxID=2950108 RepID=A0ABY4W8R0_9PROT|nr:ATP-binding cassette domain-containing protein [Sneathiella marina]USG62528.1 ATP-binding cassette domain-containing protein [Sneathiella marina]
MTETVLETIGLTMKFGGVTACDNVDFELKSQELRCLIGPNGAGKSTFFKCLTGLLRPSLGTVTMKNEETTNWDTHSITSFGVGIKTQVPSVMDGISVRENIWLAARRFVSTNRANDKATEVIERLSLEDVANTEVGRLAHGERQRVELGIVAAGDPWLVLLDEPAAGMTSHDVDQMIEIIHEMKQTAAIVIVEHDMQFIRTIATNVTVFHQGRVLMDDHVDAVMSNETVRNVYLGKKA